MKDRIFVPVIVVVFGLIIGGLIFGLSQERTSIIVGKTVDNHFNGDRYLFAMQNGDTVDVSFSDYASHDVGDNYTYRIGELV